MRRIVITCFILISISSWQDFIIAQNKISNQEVKTDSTLVYISKIQYTVDSLKNELKNIRRKKSFFGDERKKVKRIKIDYLLLESEIRMLNHIHQNANSSDTIR